MDEALATKLTIRETQRLCKGVEFMREGLWGTVGRVSVVEPGAQRDSVLCSPEALEGQG